MYRFQEILNAEWIFSSQIEFYVYYEMEKIDLARLPRLLVVFF